MQVTFKILLGWSGVIGLGPLVFSNLRGNLNFDWEKMLLFDVTAKTFGLNERLPLLLLPPCIVVYTVKKEVTKIIQSYQVTPHFILVQHCRATARYQLLRVHFR